MLRGHRKLHYGRIPPRFRAALNRKQMYKDNTHENQHASHVRARGERSTD
ncbi:hypothetical protein L249_3422 [Ophiocordyceps polyrhachis-furcata BCC 54312]|uniref:Uncharacterized protein n=1 Tax=Ophiocordyceps polyrhachis-furcata BCC 54312 TaxID=1330021 RepID=A0A367LLY2_9HYPO|nr:hypothetical protein L249_3422 [Ophiocordyceps polyrhachis-furcata BCC 54312]